MWDKLVIPANGLWAAKEESLALIYTRARNRSKRVLEHLFRAYSTEVLEVIVDCWAEQVAVGVLIEWNGILIAQVFNTGTSG